MKFLTLRTLSAFALAAVLAACGGPQDELATQNATSLQTGSATISVPVTATGTSTGTTAAGSGSTVTPGVASIALPAATATMPQPDCAADGCNSPRIIDANAEAWRYAAMQRAAADSSQS